MFFKKRKELVEMLMKANAENKRLKKKAHELNDARLELRIESRVKSEKIAVLGQENLELKQRLLRKAWVAFKEKVGKREGELNDALQDEIVKLRNEVIGLRCNTFNKIDNELKAKLKRRHKTIAIDLKHRLSLEVENKRLREYVARFQSVGAGYIPEFRENHKQQQMIEAQRDEIEKLKNGLEECSNGKTGEPSEAFVDGKKNYLNPDGLSLKKVISHMGYDYISREINRIPIRELEKVTEALATPRKEEINFGASAKESMVKTQYVHMAKGEYDLLFKKGVAK